MRTLLLAGLLVAVALAGCSDGDDAPETRDHSTMPTLAGFTTLDAADIPTFSEPLLIDAVRAGGEPVIAILPSGTILVSAHPGWTHYHPSDDPTHPGTELVMPANGQSYLWRSTDNGTTWDHVDLLDGVDNLPRSTALGVSDPEFTVMEDGTVCMTDLIGLASSSVSCSSDDGQTWLPGNSAASGGPNDRQWLASSGEELYFTANYFTDHHIRASKDHGLTWEDRGDVPCAQDLVGDPHTGHLVVACSDGISVSTDGGSTWSEVRGPEGDFGGQRIMAEPAIDGDGTTWIVLTEGERGVTVAGTPDEGRTWPWVYDLTPHFALWSGDHCPGDADGCASNGTYVWPWISAGSGGRVAVSWIGSFATEPSSSYEGPWYIFTAFLLDADTDAPSVTITQLTPDPIHTGPICQSGTTCQVTSVTGDDSGDRRLGDFFETTIDAQGRLHGVWSNTQARPDDVISHPQYVRQTGGVSLIAEEDLGVWTPTQG